MTTLWLDTKGVEGKKLVETAVVIDVLKSFFVRIVVSSRLANYLMAVVH